MVKCKTFFLIAVFLLLASVNFAEDIPAHFKAQLEKNDSDHFFSEFINMLMTLGLIVSVVLLAAFFIKKLMNSQINSLNSNSSIKIIDKHSISARSVIYVIEVQGEKVIVGESINGLTHLNPIDSTKNKYEEL